MPKQGRPLCVDPKREVDGRGRGPRRAGFGRHEPPRRVGLMRAAQRAAGVWTGRRPWSARKCKRAWPGNGPRKLPTAPKNQSS